MSGIDDFSVSVFEHSGTSHRVFRRGSGPAVVLMHELPGMTGECIDLGWRISNKGFTVFLPLLFGEPGDHAAGKFFFRLCIRREFKLFAAGKSSPVTDWLRELCRSAHSECSGPGVGVIGMCLTGNFVLSMMVEPVVMAPVLSQPSLPLVALGESRKRALAVSPEELASAKQRTDGGLPLLGFRFSEDLICPPQRFERLRQVFGDAFEAHEIDSSAENPDGISGKAHSVLTREFVDRTGHPTRRALDRVLGFLKARLQPEVSSLG